MRERKDETCKREREKDKMELCGSRGSVVAGFGQKKKKTLRPHVLVIVWILYTHFKHLCHINFSSQIAIFNSQRHHYVINLLLHSLEPTHIYMCYLLRVFPIAPLNVMPFRFGCTSSHPSHFCLFSYRSIINYEVI